MRTPRRRNSTSGTDLGILEHLEDRRLLSAGSLDPTWGDNGRVILGMNLNDVARDVAVQPADGKVVVVGWWETGETDRNGVPNTQFTTVRLNTDGTLDESFGSFGTVSTTVPGWLTSKAFDVAIQADGKILVGGISLVGLDTSSGRYAFEIVRYNTNGTVDTSFGSNPQWPGFVLLELGRQFNVATSLALSPVTGKIAVAGYVDDTPLQTDNGDRDLALIQLNANGTVDSGFDSDGIVITDVGGFDDQVFDVTYDANEKIVVAGRGGTATGSDFLLARYNTNGSLDTSFGDLSTGWALADLGAGDTATSLAIQPDGRIVIGGYVDPTPDGEGAPGNGDQDSAIGRFTSLGVLDTSFLSVGLTAFAASSSDNIVNAVAVQPNGKLVTTGYALEGVSRAFTVSRFLSDGVVDSAFGTSGTVITPIFAGDESHGLALQSDGKIVVAGFSTNPNFAATDFTIVRYVGDPPPGVTVTPTSGLVTAEGGGTATFTVVLNTQPTADVTIGISSDDATEGTVSTGNLTFTTGNWNTAQTITVTGVDDAVDDGDIAYNLVTATATSSDINYNGINPGNVSATNTDNDTGNTAPVLDNTGLPYLVAPAGSRLPVEMANGILITDLLTRGAGGNPITDPDPGALKGIALTAIDNTLGKWQYTFVNNPTEPDWIDADSAGPVSNTSALLLPADTNTRLRFVTTLIPYHGSSVAAGHLPTETKLDTGLTFRAWDRTTGTAGARADSSTNGDATAFSTATETVATYFEVRLWRTFNAAAQLNTYTLELEATILINSFGYQDRSTSSFTGFTVLMSPIPGVPTAPLYRMYFGIAFDSPSAGIQTDMGYRYLTTSLPEAEALELMGPADKHAQRDGAYFREAGVNSGTGIMAYINTTAQPGTTEMSQIYRTDLFPKDTRTGPAGTPATGTVQQQQGDHVYTTNSAFEMTKTPGRPHIEGVQTGWRQEISRGFVRELSPNAGGVQQPARQASLTRWIGVPLDEGPIQITAGSLGTRLTVSSSAPTSMPVIVDQLSRAAPDRIASASRDTESTDSTTTSLRFVRRRSAGTSCGSLTADPDDAFSKFWMKVGQLGSSGDLWSD
ncbi:MAG: hypothetical protein HZA46_13005 [Planctomycetales bacterium]|nr:hypothetical protein [Planctomycetales bacterium]